MFCLSVRMYVCIIVNCYQNRAFLFSSIVCGFMVTARVEEKSNEPSAFQLLALHPLLVLLIHLLAFSNHHTRVCLVLIQVDRNRRGKRGRFQLLVLLHFQHLNVTFCLLQFVVIDDILIGGTGLREGIQLVHVIHIPPQGR